MQHLLTQCLHNKSGQVLQIAVCYRFAALMWSLSRQWQELSPGYELVRPRPGAGIDTSEEDGGSGIKHLGNQSSSGKLM